MINLNNRKGAFSDVEQIKSSKVKIKQDHQIIIMLTGVMVVGLVLFLFFADFNKHQMFFSPLTYFLSDNHFVGLKGKELMYKQKFIDNYLNFFIFMSLILYCLSSIYFSKLHAIKTKKSLSAIDIFLKIFYLPSALFFKFLNSIFIVPKDLEAKIALENAWLEKLDRDFFNQIVQKEDGYHRVDKLTIFDDLGYVFGEEAQKGFKRLFKSDEELEDLLKIIEGYLIKAHLFDELWKGENDLELFPNANTPSCKKYDDFKSYKLRFDVKDEVYKDSVVFSLNALKIFVQKHTKIFYHFLDKGIYKYSNIDIGDDHNCFLKIAPLQNDISFRKKITKYCKQKDIIEFWTHFSNVKTLLSNEKAREILFEFLTIDFMVIVFRSVIERYMGLPAGMLVVKIEDYDTRMIIETYKLKSFIKIVPMKNDGSSAQYESDNYVNLFLTLLYEYFNSEKNNFFTELQDKFNTDITEIPTQEVNCA